VDDQNTVFDIKGGYTAGYCNKKNAISCQITYIT